MTDQIQVRVMLVCERGAGQVFSGRRGALLGLSAEPHSPESPLRRSFQERVTSAGAPRLSTDRVDRCRLPRPPADPRGCQHKTAWHRKCARTSCPRLAPLPPATSRSSAHDSARRFTSSVVAEPSDVAPLPRQRRSCRACYRVIWQGSCVRSGAYTGTRQWASFWVLAARTAHSCSFPMRTWPTSCVGT
jgi:hypothetical protein